MKPYVVVENVRRLGEFFVVHAQDERDTSNSHSTFESAREAQHDMNDGHRTGFIAGVLEAHQAIEAMTADDYGAEPLEGS